MKPICIVIAGITASGKSKLAIQLAKVLNAEIISADSVAVYKEFNIGSAKASPEERAEIPHHLIDVISYKERYDVARFQREARACIRDIQQRGKPVIVVGGTGLYLKALLYDYRFEDEQVISESFDSMTNQTLFQCLREKDPEVAQKLHVNNRKRVIRALIAYENHHKSQSDRTQNLKNQQIIDAKVFFLTGPRDVMYQRMEARVDQMFEAGLREEVGNLIHNDPDFFMRQSTQAIGYREFKAYFLNHQNEDEVKEAIKRDTRRFSKRQWTWFKHQMASIPIDITCENPYEVIIDKITTM